MKFAIRIGLGGVMALAISSAACAQAFGIAPGTPIRDLKIVRTISPTFFSVTVPLPNDRFESYTVMATPQAGVCKVTGLGKTLEGDRYGTEARAVFAGLKAAMVSRYGAPKSEFDFLKSRALWDGPNEWASSIEHNERTYAAYWFEVTEDIVGIEMDVRALSSSKTYVTLGYEFSNFAACKAEKDAVNDRGL